MTLPDEDSPVIIDAMLGSGLNKPLAGDYKKLVKYLNGLKKTVVAVDVPTGFFAEGEIKPDATVLKADLVITFQQPRLIFCCPNRGRSLIAGKRLILVSMKILSGRWIRRTSLWRKRISGRC